jgi:hypothetical protein
MDNHARHCRDILRARGMILPDADAKTVTMTEVYGALGGKAHAIR